jgi:hypothetical protein
MTDALVNAPRFRWLRRSAVGCGWFFVILFAAGLLGRGCLMEVGSQRMAVFEAETDQSDPGWRWEDVLKDRAVVADDENASLCVLAAHSMLPKDWPRKPAAAPAKKASSPPEPLGTRLQQLDPYRRLNEALAAELREELKPLAPALAEARKVAALPRGRYEITWEHDLYSTLLPHAEKLRNVAELLVLDVVLRTQEGDIPGALASVRALLNTGRSIGDEPLFISQLVRGAVVHRAIEMFQCVLAQSAASEEQLTALSKLLENEEEEAPGLLYRTARAERAAMARMLEMAANGEIDLQQLANSRSNLVEQALSWPVMRPLVRYGEAPTLDLMTRYLQDLKLPPKDRRVALEAFELELRQMKANVHKHPQMIPALLLLPAFVKIVDALDREQAVLRCAVAAVALERYRLAKGRWPDSLEELKPTLLVKVPDDPYGTGPLGYRRLGDGVVVYSIGPANGAAIDWDKPTRPNISLGFRLWDPTKRGLPPAPEPLPAK